MLTMKHREHRHQLPVAEDYMLVGDLSTRWRLDADSAATAAVSTTIPDDCYLSTDCRLAARLRRCAQSSGAQTSNANRPTGHVSVCVASRRVHTAHSTVVVVGSIWNPSSLAGLYSGTLTCSTSYHVVCSCCSSSSCTVVVIAVANRCGMISLSAVR